MHAQDIWQRMKEKHADLRTIAPLAAALQLSTSAPWTGASSHGAHAYRKEFGNDRSKTKASKGKTHCRGEFAGALL